VSRDLIEFQVRVHRGDAEDTEAAQRPDSGLCAALSGLGAFAVKWLFAELQFAQNPDAHPQLVVLSFGLPESKTWEWSPAHPCSFDSILRSGISHMRATKT
jgi:hypothetical protein